MLDIISITVKSGKGGDGCVAARREAGVPFGGPAGGDGGRGGDVIMRATKDEQTLSRFRYHSKIESKDGQDGMIKDMYGANAENLSVPVPIGTIVKNTQSGTILFQFTEDGQEYRVAKGGKGGAGNIHFANAVQQYPTFALLGEPGQERPVTLELQMLGDVGLVGTPSVGKSSIINSCCATRAKTAEYHFTTLEPAIGICDKGPKSFSIVDIPGLIAGASEGKGLGNQFLRHVLKAKVFAFVADLSRYEQSFAELTNVIDEIFLYIHQRFVGSTEFGDTIENIQLTVRQGDSEKGPIIISCIATSADRTWTLFDKAIHLLVNKYDMVNDIEIANELVQALCEYLTKHLSDRRSLSVSPSSLIHNSFVVSAATHFGLDERIHKIGYLMASTDLKTMTLLDRVEKDLVYRQKIKEITEEAIPFLVDEGYIEPKTAKRVKVRLIDDEEICRLSYTLPRGNEQAEHRFWRVMLKQNHLVDFDKAGIVHGDILKIQSTYAKQEDKYVMVNV